jgi:hypothetical protein
MSRQESVEADVRVPRGTGEVGQVFENHYGYFADKAGEVATQQQSGETAIRREYSGRVVFELLQNALDRADERVEVRLVPSDVTGEEHVLVVANDGLPVRVDRNYEYRNQSGLAGEDRQRSDFNALCSVHTSNKSSEDSIGTKGIGFRSVFSLETHVRVWSRFADRGGWWGLEMHSPLDFPTWEERQAEPTVARGIKNFLNDVELPPIDDGELRPSYHFPLPIAAETAPPSFDDETDLSTVVAVPVPDKHVEQVTDSITEFRDRHLLFTGLDPGNRNVTVRFQTPDQSFSLPTWPSSDTELSVGWHDWSITHWQSEALSDLAEEAKYEASEPGAAVAWPPTHQSARGDGESGTKSVVYGYLPTLIDGPFGADFHGDFQLSIDRTNIRYDDEVMGPYNERLVQIGAELHLLEAVRRVPGLVEAIEWEFIDPTDVERVPDGIDETRDRPDFWHFLNPNFDGGKTGDIAVAHVAELLFDPDFGAEDPEKYDRWARLAAGYFEQRDEWPTETYQSFWAAVQGWVDHFCSTKTRQKTWRRTAEALCDALRETEASVAPVKLGTSQESSDGLSAVPLPSKGGSVGTDGQPSRNDRELFLWTADDGLLTLPRALQADNRAVTAYDFPSDLYERTPNALGVTKFSRWEVLAELQQLPNSIDSWSHEPLKAGSDTTPEETAELQLELIRFACQLYRLDTGGNQQAPSTSDDYDTGWRMHNEPSDNARSAGRALATLFLPTTEGRWEPARQLTRDRVATDQLDMLPSDVDLDAFLSFLGVAPEPPDDGVEITLIEGGEEGRVAPRAVPPKLTPAGPGRRDATLGTLPDSSGVEDPEAWQRSLHAAWDDWLESLIRLEREAVASEDITCRTELVRTLRDRPWYPAQTEAMEEQMGAIPPVVMEPSPGSVAPKEIVVHVPQQNQLPKPLWSVADTAETSEMLRALGAIDGLDEDSLRRDGSDPSFRILNSLQQLPLERIEEQARLRRSLVRLFNRVLNAIVRGDNTNRGETALHLLTYQGADARDSGIALSDRRLQWQSLDEPAWIAAGNAEQGTMRRYFPETPLVAATVPTQVLNDYAPLTDRGIELERTVRSDPPGGTSDEIAAEVAETFADIIPELLALADAATDLEIDMDEVAERWGPDRFRHAENVWLEVRATLGDEQIDASQFKTSRGQALVTGEDHRAIVFDTPEGSSNPPLDAFGEPLALLLFAEEGKEVGSLFARALQCYTDGPERLRALLEEKGAVALVETYERAFDGLSPKEHDLLVERVESALAGLGLTLESTATSRLRALSPADLDPTEVEAGLTESEVNEVLDAIELPDSRDWGPYRPRFRCRDTNRADWEHWVDTHRNTLIPYLLDLLHENRVADVDEETIDGWLDEEIPEKACARIDFTPERAVTSWLDSLDIDGAEIPEPRQLTEELERYATSFGRVTEVLDPDDAGFVKAPRADPEPNQTERPAPDDEDYMHEHRAQMAVGQDAELAALPDVVERTQECLDDVLTGEELETIRGTEVATLEDAIDVLCWPFSDGLVTETHVRETLEEYGKDGADEERLLSEALHISEVWDGAGFDLVGLSLDEDGRLQPARYEIKSVSGDGAKRRVHLSKNQFAVYESVHREETGRTFAGDWQLLGIQSDGSAINLTAWLADLPTDALAALRNEGFEHDGLVLEFSRADVTE